MRQLKPKIAHFIRFNLAKFKFRYLVRYRYYILPFVLVLITVALTTLAITTPSIQSYLTNGSSANTLLSSSVLTISLSVLLTIGTSLYFWIDYRQHNAPLKQADPKVHYSFKHHLKVVTFPLLRFKWKPLSYASVMISMCLATVILTIVLFAPKTSAIAPSVSTVSSTSVTDAGVTLSGVISTIPDKNITARGFEYGTTNSYGATAHDNAPSNFTYDAKWGSVGTGNGQFGSNGSINVLAVNSQQETYVADKPNNRIQKFDSQGAFMFAWGSTGSGNGQFSIPIGIDTDLSGNVYVADAGNTRIQKFDSSGTYILQWAIPSNALFVIVDSADNVYVAGGTKVRKYTTTGTYITEWGSNIQGSNDGEFSQIQDMVASSDGYIYVADAINNDVQKFSNTGTFLTKWDTQGTANGEFNGITGLGADYEGNFYVSDYFHRVQKFNSSGSYVLSFGSTDGSPGSADGIFYNPLHIDFDSGGNAYVADNQNFRVQRFTKPGTFPHGPYSMDVSNLSCATTYYFRAFATNSDGTNFGSEGNFTTKACPGSAPTVVTTLGSSVITQDSATLRGEISSFSGNSTVTARGIEYGLTASYGDVLSSSVPSNYSYEKEWGSAGTASGQFNLPSSIATNNLGQVYVADRTNSTIQKFGSQGNFIAKWGSIGSSDGQFSELGIGGVAIDSDGNVYVSDWKTARVQKFDSSGNFITKWGSVGGSNGQFLSGPMGLAVDSSNNVFVSDHAAGRIIKFTSTGSYISKVGSYGSGNGQFTYVYSIAIDGSDNLYVSDMTQSRIQKLNSSGTYVTKWTVTGFQYIAADSVGNVYLQKTANNQIIKYSTTGVIVNQWGESGNGAGQTQGAWGIAVGPNGDVYTTDYLGLKVIKFINPGSYPRGEFTENATSLTCGTTYHYRAFATDTDGTSFGQDQTFVTDSCPVVFAPNEFVTTWKTDNPGTSNSNQIRIPTFPGDIYNYTVDWGDGNTSTGQTGDSTHTYSSAGTYTVKITGTFPRIYTNNNYDRQKLLTVEQWGSNAWSSLAYAFYGASNLTIPATDSPYTTFVNDMSGMFYQATSFNSDISSWDTSGITNMYWMFAYATSFNQPLNSWNVSNVTDMSGMFNHATSFIQPLNSWDVSSVTRMGHMLEATSLNQPLNNWDVSNVTDMQAMFALATSFNQPLNNWDVRSVTDMSGMFNHATSFNQPLNSWDVSNIQSMTGLFFVATSFNQPLNNWNVSNVTNMSTIFSGASSFNQSLATWDVSNVLYMNSFFGAYMNVTPDVGISTPNYDATLIGWNNLPLQSSVTFDAGTSKYCTSETQRQSIIDYKFWAINDSGKDCSAPTTEPFIMRIKTDNVGATNDNQYGIALDLNSYSYNFNVDCDSDGTLEYENYTGDSPYNAVICTYDSPGEYDVSISGTFPYMRHGFEGGCAGVQIESDAAKIMDIKQWGDIQWQDMSSMFYCASNMTMSATDIPDLSNVFDMSFMFMFATSFNSNINTWDVSNVTSMLSMFNSASSFNQPLDTWDVSNVNLMIGMFSQASSFNQPLNNWNVSGVTSTMGMFAGASSFNQPLNNWNVSNVTSMVSMFTSAQSFDQSLASWDVSSVSSMDYMFGNYNALLEQIMSGTPFEDWPQMYKDMYNLPASGLSTPNYDATLIDWNNRPLQSTVIFDAGTSQYCNAEAQRANIISTHSWTINDAGINCSSGPAQTDFSITKTLITPGPIQSGDNVTYHFKIKNEGPNDSIYGGFLYDILPTEFTFISNTNPNVTCMDMGLAEDIDEYFGAFYPGRHILACLPTNGSDALASGSSVEFDITGTANSNYVTTETTNSSMYFDPNSENSFNVVLMNAVQSNIDFTTLPYNNVSNVTYVYPPATPDPDPDPTPTPTPTPTPRPTPRPRPRPTPRPTPTPTPTPPTTTTTTPATGGSSPGSPAVRDLQDVADREVLGQRTAGILPLPLYNFVHKASDSAALGISWLLLLILLILATIYGWKAYAQFRANQLLVAALTRLRNTKQATDTYLQITTHYLNTPVAIMSGALELLASLKKLPAQSINHLESSIAKYKTAVEALAIDGEAAITDAPALSSPTDSRPESTSYVANLLATVPQSGSALKNRAVYLPLAIVGGTFAIVTFMFANAQVYQLSPVQLGLQLLCLLLSGVLLATTYRQRDLKRATQAVTKAAITTEQQLIAQRTSFIDRASKTLSDHYETLSITCHNLSTMPEARTLLNGLAMLGDTAKSLTNVSRLSHLSPDAPLSNLVLDIPRLLMPLQPLATTKQLTLTTHIPPHLNLSIQPEELQQLIHSTVSNAIQFSPANNTVDITAKQQGKHIVLSITDHGPGIPTNKLDQLFQPFSRATETETYDHPGLGLNLHVNKLITEKLGGTIDLTSTTAPATNTGTTVTISLPAAKPSANVAPVMVVPGGA